MIGAAISHLAGQLNAFLKRGIDTDEDLVVLSGIQQQDGTGAPHIDNKLVVFVANIERDTLPQNGVNGRSPAARVVETKPPLHLNLYVMIAACFGGANYPEGLKRLSAAVAYFQANPVFDAQRSPELDRRISRLVLDIENLDIQAISTLWGVLGGTYLPSVLYRVRMITVDAGSVLSEPPTIRRPRLAMRT